MLGIVQRWVHSTGVGLVQSSRSASPALPTHSATYAKVELSSGDNIFFIYLFGSRNTGARDEGTRVERRGLGFKAAGAGRVGQRETRHCPGQRADGRACEEDADLGRP